MSNRQTERLLWISQFRHPGNRHFCDDLSIVACLEDTLSINVKCCVVVLSLAQMSDPVIKSCSLLIVIFAHVEFTDVRSFVACGLQLTRVALQLGGVIGEIVDDHVCMRI